MEVKDILDQSVIDLKMNVSDKHSAIEHLSQLLYQAGYLSDLSGYIKDVYVRESEGITGMGNHIAIPHGKSNFVKKVGIAIGKSEKMVEWESYDDQPVNYIFLFAVPSDNENAKVHLKLLAELASKLGNDSIMKKLEHCTHFEELEEVFST